MVQHSISLSGQVCMQKMIKLSDFFFLFMSTFCSLKKEAHYCASGSDL